MMEAAIVIGLALGVIILVADVIGFVCCVVSALKPEVKE